MKIDGVSAEPCQGDNPFAMGPVALDIDCDLDVLAHKVRTGGSNVGDLGRRGDESVVLRVHIIFLVCIQIILIVFCTNSSHSGLFFL